MPAELVDRRLDKMRRVARVREPTWSPNVKFGARDDTLDGTPPTASSGAAGAYWYASTNGALVGAAVGQAPQLRWQMVRKFSKLQYPSMTHCAQSNPSKLRLRDRGRQARVERQ